MNKQILNLFYEEPDCDRWLLFDRYPRKIIRRIVRGKPRIGGQQRVFLNLCAGLDKLGISYRVNDYKYIQNHTEEVACIIGKPFVIDKIKWKNPILFGASVFAHPLDDPDLLERLPVKKVLVPGEWMRQMFEPYYKEKVLAWPVGIDTELWKPNPNIEKDIDILLYDKVRWKHDLYEQELINPILAKLKSLGLNIHIIRYGFYREEDFHSLLARSKAMVFLCEHETQGIAYQQALSCGVPILAWNRGGYWQDPCFFPHKVKYESVSSVPYWSDRCGVKFQNIAEFSVRLDEFLGKLTSEQFNPREYILNNLTLEQSAKKYLDIWQQLNTQTELLIHSSSA